jgi:hypothetical protein
MRFGKNTKRAIQPSKFYAVFYIHAGHVHTKFEAKISTYAKAEKMVFCMPNNKHNCLYTRFLQELGTYYGSGRCLGCLKVTLSLLETFCQI